MKSIIRHATFLLIHKKGQTKKKMTFSVPSKAQYPFLSLTDFYSKFSFPAFINKAAGIVQTKQSRLLPKTK